jgi:RHS repeat-associated protein
MIMGCPHDAQRPRQGGPVTYTYCETGHVSNITIRDGDPRVAACGSQAVGDGTSGKPPDAIRDTWVCHDLGLFYSTDGKLRRARWSQWDENSEGPVAGSLEYTGARRFYYIGPRQRYLTWEADPTTWELLEEGEEPTQTWTTYLGDMPWADFTVDGDWTPTKVRDYVGADGLHAQIDAATGDVEFLHGDLIGSTMLTTDESGAPCGTTVSAVTYTAFGEPVVSDGSTWHVGGALPEGYPRYAYAGQFGYESDLLAVQGTNETLPPVTLAHVGYRWYQAGIGRFVQRDPIGIAGGPNLYTYASNNPVSKVDPSGKFAGWIGGAVAGGLIGGVVGGIGGYISGGVGGMVRGAVAGAIGGAVTGGLIGAGCDWRTAGRVGGALNGALLGLLNSLARGYSAAGAAAYTGFLICVGGVGGQASAGAANALGEGLVGTGLAELGASGITNGAGVIIDLGAGLMGAAGRLRPRDVMIE